MLRILLAVAVCYIAYAALAFLLQRNMIFPRFLISQAEDFMKPPDIEVFRVNTGYEEVETWFMPAEPVFSSGRSPAVIFAHGNAELIDSWPQYLKPFTQNGLHVLLVEYPGYGRSTGKPSESSITRAFVAAYDHLVARENVDPGRIILFGRSLGGGAVCSLAKERPSAAIILSSTFTSISSFALKYGLPSFVIRDPMDNLNVLKQYKAPVLLFHGIRDEVIPFEHARTLAAASGMARLITYDSGHNDCPPDWDVFWRDVFDFLSDHSLVQPSGTNLIEQK